MWVMTTIHDDGDPGDHASLDKVRVFSSLEGVREAFKALRTMYPVDVGLSDFPEAKDMAEVYRICREAPEQYGWCSRDTSDDFGWDGGTLVQIDFVEVEP